MSGELDAIDEALLGDAPRRLRDDPRRLLDAALAPLAPAEALSVRCEADRALAIDDDRRRVAAMRALIKRLKGAGRAA